MQQRWFKMPIGSGQNPKLAIIANKLNISRSLVISVFMISCELSEKSQDADFVEVIAYMLGEGTDTIENILNQIKERGISGVDNTISSNAERQKRYRERNALRNGDVTPCNAVTLERPDQKDQKERPDQKERGTLEGVTGAPGQVGSFLKGLGVGGRSFGRFDIEPLLESEDFFEIQALAPAWDRKALFRKYNEFVANDPPRKPRQAFIGWLKKFTAGQGANP